MTKLQRITMLSVLRATATEDDAWYRAGADEAHGSPAGERVTLASLHRAHLLTRRAWRGVEGQPSAAYEYRATEQLIELARETGLLDLVTGKGPVDPEQST